MPYKMGKGREISNQGSDSKKKKTIGGGRKIGPVSPKPKPGIGRPGPKPGDGRRIGRPVLPMKKK
jgi:hypothetical protein